MWIMGGGGGSSKVSVAYSRHSGSIQCLEQAELVGTRTTICWCVVWKVLIQV